MKDKMSIKFKITIWYLYIYENRKENTRFKDISMQMICRCHEMTQDKLVIYIIFQHICFGLLDQI